MVSCTWDETLYNILIEVKECFPNACFRTICLMGSGMHSAVKNSDKYGWDVQTRRTMRILHAACNIALGLKLIDSH